MSAAASDRTTDVGPPVPRPVSELVADRARLGRQSTAERVAEVLRERIAAGFFPPGVRLSEEAIGGALGVSRNTLREAFRLLGHERLVVHELNRGVFVRVLSVDDLLDLYRVRRVVEAAAVRRMSQPPAGALRAVRDAVETAERAGAAGHWGDVVTADLRFHQAITALAGSPRLTELMRGVLAELRLVFSVMRAAPEFHVPYLTRNRELLALLEAGDARAAERELLDYLDDAERELLDAYQRGRRDLGQLADAAP